MSTVWARRREELLRDCIVSPDIFILMVDRLSEFVVPYQQALETEAGQHPMHLYLQGLLSHLPRKNAEEIAAWIDVERQVIQDFIGTASWDHRPLVTVLVPCAVIMPRVLSTAGFRISPSVSFWCKSTESVSDDN
jgi:hypothetical protein